MKPYLPACLVLTVITAAVLSACGGGGAASGAPASIPTPPPATQPATPGQSTVSGTVTGFGSVIIDGVRIDNSAVLAGKVLENGSVRQVELKLGQHVEVQHDGQLLATQVRVGANAEGLVTAVNAAAGTLTVAGQAIIINTDATLGPVTVFEAYTSLAAVLPNDRVEVHGLIKIDSSGKASLQATRIEKTSATGDSADRVNGFISDLSASSHTFKLGGLLVDYTASKILPEGATLANGVEVNVAVPLGTVVGGAAVKATVVTVRDHKGEVGAKDTELGGAISALDTSAKTLTVGGVKVDISAAKFNQAGRSLADLTLNAYVVIKGSYASDGTLKAATIVLRGKDDAKDQQVELHGSVLRFVSVSNFTVRDVTVDATGVTLDAATCGAAALANNLQVDVRGTLQANGSVKASSISCEKTSDTHLVLSREGLVGNIDLAAKTFSLTTSKETLSMKWSGATLFLNVDATTLSGKTIEIEGSLSNGVYSVTKISLKNS
ncbi:MAG: DUF5666 domain-containing protein [Massilia sp.]